MEVMKGTYVLMEKITKSGVYLEEAKGAKSVFQRLEKSYVFITVNQKLNF